jgi:sulfur carrier protein
MFPNELESISMVQITFRNKKFEVKENMTARDALKKINIDPESVLISVNGKLVTDDFVLRAGDVVKLVAVISGG